MFLTSLRQYLANKLVTNIKCTVTMNKQAKISSFFNTTSPLNQKRVNIEESTNKTAKKQKVDTSLNDKLDQENLGPSSPPATNSSKGDGASDSPKSPPLTPEQKQKVNENKLQAQMKRVDKETEGLVVNMGSTWFNALQGEFAKPYFLQLSKFVAAERKSQTIFPPVQEVFFFTTMCPISTIKVVILGQDPYHGDKQAHGLCFSVQKGITPPPSLQNMYKELCTDIPGFTHPGHGYLAGWAQQGVLLLNAVLTVRAHNANSHKDKGWEKFTDAVITHINKNMDGVVFMLWGAYAQKKGAYIDKKRHHILKGVHPSPLSAHRGYFGCKHFSKCNELLEEAGKKPIDWKHLPLP